MPTEPTPTSRVYFPGLNALRFAAATLVMLRHIEQISMRMGYPNALSLPIATAKLAVVFFFVLSGYLITYLLLREKQDTGTIEVLNFYRRRILRIWPIYYLMVALAFFVFPHLPHLRLFDLPGWRVPSGPVFWEKLGLFVFMLPNAVTPFVVPYIGHFWSIGVEEQFYAIWPALVRFTRRVPLVLLGVIGGYWVVYTAIILVAGVIEGPNPWLRTAEILVRWMRFDCMAIGGLGAVLVFHRSRRVLAFLWSPAFQVAVYVLTIGLWLSGWMFHRTLYYELFSVLFCAIILNVSTNPRSLLKLEWQPLTYLGKISYGMYVYHVLAIGCVMAAMNAWRGIWSPTLLHTLLLYPLVMGLTILISALSYHGFEQRFLGAKRRYSKIVSGDQAYESDDPARVGPAAAMTER